MRGQKGHGPPKFVENIVILCFERRFSKENRVRLKSNILAPPKIFGLVTPQTRALAFQSFNHVETVSRHVQKIELVEIMSRRHSCDFDSSSHRRSQRDQGDMSLPNF